MPSRLDKFIDMFSNSAINLATWLTLLFSVVIIGVTASFSRLALCARCKATEGKITYKFPSKHFGISYTYEVKGRAYKGDGCVEHKNAFDAIKVGDTINVLYDEAKPSNSTLDSPNVLVIRTIGGIVAAAAIIPIIGMCVLHRAHVLPDSPLFRKMR